MELIKEKSRLASDFNQIISFRVGAEDYGLELANVKEVIRMRDVTWLPKAPPFIKGIINLRGKVIPIVDLRCKFGLESAEQTAATRVIVVEVKEKLMGMVVDSASQVMRVPTDQIDPPPLVVGYLSREYISGVAKLDDKLVILMDIKRIFTAEEAAAVSMSAEAIRPVNDRENLHEGGYHEKH